MNSLNARVAVTAVVLCTSIPYLLASGPVIGFAMADGSFQLDRSTIRGNATLLDGSTLETGAAASRLQLNDGVQLKLAPESRARIFAARTVLEQGTGQLQSSSAYNIEALGLRITSAEPNSVAQVRLQAAKTVQVAALTGAVRVTNAAGVVVGNLVAGMSVAFTPQAGSQAPTTASGCLLSKGGKLILVDQTTNVTLEVEGSGLAGEVGNQVKVTGSPSSAAPTVSGATQVVTVSTVDRVAKGGCASVAKKVGAATGAAAAAAAAAGAASAGTAAGLSTAAIVAIVGGVAAAGTVGGLAAAGTFSSKSSTSSASR
jgi:hypothetical protein